jgi:hypothetical protein
VEWFLLFYIILILIFLFIVKIIRIHFNIYIYIYIFFCHVHTMVGGEEIRSCDFPLYKACDSQPIELQLGDHFKYIILWFSRGRLIG